MELKECRLTAADGVELVARCWPSASAQPRATVVVLHGIVEHGGRHAFLAEGLAARGYAVHALDLRGHGLSAGPRGSLRRFSQYLDDLGLWLEWLKQNESPGPLFVFGHSMGAQIALLYAIERQPDWAGIIASSPYLMPGKGLFPWLRRWAGVFSVIWPRLRLVRMTGGGIAQDPKVVEAFRQDPLVYHDRFEVRLGAEAMAAGRRILRNAARLRLPLLAIHGTADRVASPAGSEELVRRAGSPDKRLIAYEGLWHECLSEAPRETVRSDILAWLDARSEGTRWPG